MEKVLTYTTQSRSPIIACAISCCGSYLAFNSDTQTLTIIYLKSVRTLNSKTDDLNQNSEFKVLFSYNMGSPVLCLNFGRGNVINNRLPHRSSKRRITYPVMNDVCLLAVGLKSGQVKIYSLIPGSHFDESQPLAEKEGNAKLILFNHYQDIVTVSFSRDGSLRLASSSIDGKLCLWDMWDDGNMYKNICIQNNFRPSCCAWGNKSKEICITGNNGRGYIYQSEKPCVKLTTLAQVHYNDISSCEYSSDDSLLGTSSYDTSVVIWCAGTYRPMLQIWHSGSKPSLMVMGSNITKLIRFFAFSPDCVHLVSVSDDNMIRMWNLEETEVPVDIFQVPVTRRKLYLNNVNFTPDGTIFVVCTSEGQIHFFSTEKSIDSLANMCRKSVREKLVNQLHLLVQNDFSELNNGFDLKQNLKSQPNNRRRCHSDAFSTPTKRELLNFTDVVDELPIPGILKSYLQYGLIGSQLIGNIDPRPIGYTATRHMSISN